MNVFYICSYIPINLFRDYCRANGCICGHFAQNLYHPSAHMSLIANVNQRSNGSG